MLRKAQIENQTVEEVQEQSTSLSLYFDAYHYSLELCDDPEIARQVASRFIESMQTQQELPMGHGRGKLGD